MATVISYQRPVFKPPTIHWAVESGSFDEVQRILLLERGKGYPPSVCLAQRDELLGVTPLHVAAELGNLKMIQFLLDQGMDVNCHDNTNTTPLHLAAWGAHVEAVRLLAGRGGLVTLQDVCGDQALHSAATKGHTQVVELLLDLGAPHEAANCDGWSALHRAAFNGRAATCQLLLQRGASVQALTGRGDTPLHLACRNNHLAVVQLLLECKARARFCNYAGELPWHQCIGQGARSLLLQADPQAEQELPNRRAAGSAVPAALASSTAARGLTAAEAAGGQAGLSRAGSSMSAAPTTSTSASQLAVAPPAATMPSGVLLARGSGSLGKPQEQLTIQPAAAGPPSKTSSSSQLQLPGDVAAVQSAFSALKSFVAVSQGQEPVGQPRSSASGDLAAGGGISRLSTSLTNTSQRTIRVSGALRIDTDGFPSELDGHE